MKFMLLILLYHIIILLAVFDVYFKSPIIYGMQSIKNDVKPLAKRVLLFVGDGIRSDKFFDGNLANAPFLRSLVAKGAPWGISYARVPTESRPGHVAIIAGIYEDPSAVFKGWRENPVYFDSVFNQSSATYSWGSPDIVPMFTNEMSNPNIHYWSYNSDIQDFSGKNNTATILNIMVAEQFEIFLNRAHQNKETFDKLTKNRGVIYFFHLLGVDVVGHIRKPYSEYYQDAIRNTDEVIENITKLAEKFFGDTESAYIFTSDHGMTDWGSHGAGSKDEIETPLIAWGAGISKSHCNDSANISCRFDIHQADIAPLISIILGNSIPVHSTGQLPLAYLDLDLKQKCLALFLNAKQIIEQLNIKETQVAESIARMLFTPYSRLTLFMQEEFYNRIAHDIQNKNYAKAIKDIELVIMEALNGIQYYDRYFQGYKLFFLVLTYLALICYLFSKIVPCIVIIERKYLTKLSNKFTIHALARFITLNKILPILILILLIAYSIPLMIILYTLLPIPIFVLSFWRYHWHKLLYNKLLSINFILKAIVYFLGLQIIHWSFYYRYILSVSMLCLSLWPYYVRKIRYAAKIVYINWSISFVFLAIFPLLAAPVGSTSTISVQTVTILLFPILIFSTTTGLYLWYIFDHYNSFRNHYGMILTTLICLPTYMNIIFIDNNFIHGYGLTSLNQFLSYTFLAFYIVSMFFGPDFVVPRFFSISFSLGIIFVLLSSGAEALFIPALTVNLSFWIIAEISARMPFMDFDFSKVLKVTITKSLRPRNRILHEDVQHSFFYLYYVVYSFFAIGNIDSLNSFDIAWVRGFIIVFSPYLMTVLILLKTIVPFINVACAFRFVVLQTESNAYGMFLILLIFCDILSIQFLYEITNVGSWLEIGKSISHFVIIQATTLVLIALYALVAFIIRPTALIKLH